MLPFIALKSHRNQYVCADPGNELLLIANRGQLGPWETFRLVDLNTGNIQSGDAINLIAHNGQYVCAEGGGGNDGNNIVIANRISAGPWERFSIHEVGGGQINNGSMVYLKSLNGQYICADQTKGDVLVANRNQLGAWETFTLEEAPPPNHTDKIESLELKLEQLLAKSLAQGNRGSANIANFNVDGASADYRVDIRHHQVFDAPIFGPVTVYDVTTTVQGTFNPFNPISIANTEICIDLPPIVAEVTGQPRACVRLIELAALAL